MLSYRILVNFDSVHAFRFSFAILLSSWLSVLNEIYVYIQKLNQKWIPSAVMQFPILAIAALQFLANVKLCLMTVFTMEHKSG